MLPVRARWWDLLPIIDLATSALACRSPKVRSFSREPDPTDATVERVRIPLSLGPARNDLDKSGEPCVVYDVVFNTEVMDQALHAKEFKDFLVGLGMGWVMEKGGGGLDVKNFTEVKLRGNYKGKFPAMQVVRAEALIEEMEPLDEGGNGDSASGWQPSVLNPSSFSATRATAENSNYADSFRGADGFHKQGKLPGYAKVEEVPSGPETPQHRLYVDVEGGHRWAYQEGKEYQQEIQAFVVKVEMPRMDTANDADLDVTERSLTLEVEGKYELDLDLPFAVDDGAADAAWDRQKRVLTLTLPLKSWTAKAYAKARAEVAARHGEAHAGEAAEVASQAVSTVAPAAGSASVAAGGAQVPSGAASSAAAEQGKGDGGGGDAHARKREAEAAAKKKKEASEFEAALKSKLLKQSEAAQAAAAKVPPRPILGSKEEQVEKERLKQGPSVSNRLPFRCERCNWGSAATAIRKCRRCHWCEPGSKEEAEAYEQAKEHEKFRASRKQDEVGAVEETGGIEDETSVRAFKFSSRMAWELDDDSPGWLEAVREKHYGGAKTDKHKKYNEVDMIEDTPPAVSKEDARKKEEQDRVMPLPVKGLPTIEPLD